MYSHQAEAVGLQTRRRVFSLGVGGLVLATGGGGLGLWGLTHRRPGLPQHTLSLERHIMTLEGPDEIQAALTSARISAPEAARAATLAHQIIGHASGAVTAHIEIEAGQKVRRLHRLDVRFASGGGALVTRSEKGELAGRAVAANLITSVRVVRGEMDGESFYSSAVAQHINDALIAPFAQALAFDFDFQREVRTGDIFEAAFEERRNDLGEIVGIGRLLFVLMQTPAKSAALYWFERAPGLGGWFDGDGWSTVRSLMRTPIEGARVSSTFGLRVHPIEGFTKQHNGVDFAAPIGTPIYAAGDGVVEEAQSQSKKGNYVKLRHAEGWETVYLHMRSFASGVSTGALVRQGEQIGSVGVTGETTGPHLHYEVHIAGQPVDPMTLKLDRSERLSGAALAAFDKARDRIDALRVAQTQ